METYSYYITYCDHDGKHNILRHIFDICVGLDIQSFKKEWLHKLFIFYLISNHPKVWLFE